MESVLIQAVLDKVPVPTLEHSLTTYLSPLLALLPDRRLQRVVPLTGDCYPISNCPNRVAPMSFVIRGKSPTN